MADSFRKIDDNSIARDSVVTTVYDLNSLLARKAMYQCQIDFATKEIANIDAIVSQCGALGIKAT
jgi:hypothetical protein